MAASPLRIGVIGTGALGSHHARVFAGTEGVVLSSVFDLHAERARAVGAPFGAACASRLEELIENVDAAVVAVPTVSHADVASRLIAAGRHVLIEKPITSTLEDAERIVDLAKAKGVVLQVGHVERF